jgi:hypothetical protein
LKTKKRHGKKNEGKLVQSWKRKVHLSLLHDDDDDDDDDDIHDIHDFVAAS